MRHKPAFPGLGSSLGAVLLLRVLGNCPEEEEGREETATGAPAAMLGREE